MHLIQKDLIRRLVLNNPLRFSQLTRGYSYEQNVVFHINQLIKDGYIRKRERKYHLTRAGLTFSGTYDFVSLEDNKFKTLYIVFLILNKDKVLLREKTAVEGNFYKLPGGKPFFAENYEESLERIFKKDTGVWIDIKRLKHYQTHIKIQYSSNREAIFDNIYLLYKVVLTDKEVASMNNDPRYKWFKVDEVAQIKNLWPEVLYALKNKKKFHVYNFISDYNLARIDTN